MVVKYDWKCNLDKHPGRYGCPIKTAVEVISSSSITHLESYTALANTPQGKHPCPLGRLPLGRTWRS
jgi:hypothetical protein